MFPYTLYGMELKSTNTTTYLGVIIHKDLNWSEHINTSYLL